ncbi:MAG: hypothetical protein JWQ09_1095 [Segetibacter sp.]|nr:hypothetical protein [Segetibacter sp.]
MMKTIGNISAPASIIGFLFPYFSDNKGFSFNVFQICCLLLFVLSTITILYIDYKSKPKRYKNAQEINNYMYDWISNIGRIVIFTRDMTWTDEKRIKDKLIEKSRNDELIVCMPKANEFANELKGHGANIIEYSNLNYQPQSRFTIVQYGRNDAKVAIGKTYSKYHLIEEFHNGDHPLFHVAQDLVNILIKANETGRNL